MRPGTSANATRSRLTAAAVKATPTRPEEPRSIGAGGGTRTLKLFRARAPKARAVASFATPACPAIVPFSSPTNLSAVSPTMVSFAARGQSVRRPGERGGATRRVRRTEGVMGPADQLRSTF